MPAASSGHTPPGRYIGIAPVAFDAAGNPNVSRQGLRFAPEFGGVGGSMFGSLPEGEYQGDLARGFGGRPDADTAADIASGFGAANITPQDLAVTPLLNQVLLSEEGVYVRVVADNRRDAADKAALAYEGAGAEVVSPYSVTPCPKRKGVYHVRADLANPSLGRRGGGKLTGGMKPLSPQEIFNRLHGKKFHVSRRGNRISIYLIAPTKRAAMHTARRIAAGAIVQRRAGPGAPWEAVPNPKPRRMWTVIQATFSNANPLGTTPIGKLYSVNGRVGASEGKSKAEGDKEGKEQLRTIADTAAKVAVGPSVMRHHHGMYDDGGDDEGGYFVPDWYDPDADYDGADEAYVEARYEAAVDALMADAFGGVQWVAPEVAPGSWAEFNGLPDADDAGDIASGFGACGCQ